MRSVAAVFCLLFAGAVFAAVPVAERVATDASVLDRVAELSKRDLPGALLQRMVTEDIELLRGPRPDGTYENATWERFEAGRKSETFSIKPGGETMQTVELKGSFVYRVILEVPGRRMMVRRNLPVWVERVDLEYIAEGARTERTSIEIKTWLQPGEFRPVDIPAVARQATARVVATADPKGKWGNLTVSLVEARIVDSVTSPYAAAVSAAKAALKALEDNDVTAVRQHAQRMRSALAGPSEVVVTAPAQDASVAVEMQAELQLIEDLLTGSEGERREGLDRLHQLIRRVRH